MCFLTNEERKNMKKIQGPIYFVLLASIILYSTASYAQSTLRERIKARQLEKKQEAKEVKKQAYGPGDYDFSIQHDGLKRRYLVHVPPAYKGSNPVPVVLAFHGGGGDADGAVSFFKLNKKSDKEGFIVVYPEGAGKRALGKLYGVWNAGDCCGDVDDLGFISVLLDKLSNDFNVDEKRVYATGHSNGALMCYRLACELSERIAAIAPAGGHDAFKNCNPKRPVSVLHFHGTGDNCASYYGGTCGGCFAEYLNSIGIPADPTKSYWKCSSVPDYIDKWRVTNDCYGEGEVIYQNGNAQCISYQCKNNTEVVLCTIEGMGHVWPGGDYGKACSFPNRLKCRTLKKILGSLSGDLSANDMMWDFFKKHPMR